MIPFPRQPETIYVGRDPGGQAAIWVKVNGMPYVLHHSRDYTRDEWTALVEELTGTKADREAREALRLSPAERQE